MFMSPLQNLAQKELMTKIWKLYIYEIKFIETKDLKKNVNQFTSYLYFCCDMFLLRSLIAICESTIFRPE